MVDISKLQSWKSKFTKVEEPKSEPMPEQIVETKLESQVEVKQEIRQEVKEKLVETPLELKKTFVSLRHHDEYSVKQALGKTTEAMEVIKKNGLTHFAVTNYGEVSGWVNQYFTCVDNGIIPILGIEMFVNNFKVTFSEKDKKSITVVEHFGIGDVWKKNISDVPLSDRDKINANSNIVFLARNLTGYYNIIKCHNESQINGFFTKPRISEDYFSKHGEGIICILPFLNSEVFEMIVGDKQDQALKKIECYRKIFDGVYLEIGIVESDRFIEYNNKVVEFAEKNNIPCIISINSHYLKADESDTYSMLLKMGEDINVEELPGMYYKTYQEIEFLFETKFKNEIFTSAIFEKAMSNIQVILSNLSKIQLDTSPKLPKFENAEVLIREKSYAGLKLKKRDGEQKYIDRLEYELNNIIRAGFADYFLFLEDIVVFCRKNDVIVGPGRGCFKPLSRVKMSDGLYKFIADVRKGNKIISGKGNIREVEQVFEYDVDEEMVDIELDDGRIIPCTLDHEIKVLRSGEQVWIKARDIVEGETIIEIKDII